MFGITTIRQGDRVAIWNRAGAVRFVDGPRRVWTLGQAVHRLTRHRAEATEYLAVRHTDGTVQHRPGPVTAWFDPVKHDRIEQHEQVVVEPDAAVVVYRRDETATPHDAADDTDAVARRVVRGPARFTPEPTERWEPVEPQARYRAQANQYLAIRFHDGHTRHEPGPAERWLDPITHEAITVHDRIPVDANEALVVYQPHGEGAVERTVLRGPTRYLSAPDGWLHTFRWHGADPKNPRVKIPRALRFTKLRVIPDQMYMDVTDVRTADDALLTVQAMVFFELIDIERMLDQTHDPVADFINALTADVIDFAATRPFERFKRDTDQLNELDAYPNLTGRAERIGYRINKVVYRGYEANAALQAMHDHAIEARTGLQLESETETQAQELADLKLQREAERDRQQRAVEAERAEHARTMQQAAHDQTLREQQGAHDQAVAFKREVNAVELEHLRNKNAEEAGVLRGMNEMQVDLTRYLVAQYQHPDRLIRIAGGGEGTKPQFHIHD